MNYFISNYNSQNKLITSDEVLNILDKHNIQDYKIKDLSLFQKAFIHSSYCEMKDYEDYTKPDNCLHLFKESYETIEFLGDSFLVISKRVSAPMALTWVV